MSLEAKKAALLKIERQAQPWLVMCLFALLLKEPCNIDRRISKINRFAKMDTSTQVADNVKKREQTHQIHFQARRKVRQTIEEFGGTMPEDLPTPAKSIQQLQREEQKRLERGPQLPFFDEQEEL